MSAQVQHARGDVASFRLLTPAAAGAIAIIQIEGNVDAALGAIGLPALDRRKPTLCDLLGVDSGVAVRWSDRVAQLQPHGGVMVVRGIMRELDACGLTRAQVADPESEFFEADDALEALALGTVARGASPLAIDLLLDQPARWRDWIATRGSRRESLRMIEENSRLLDRLLAPPAVAAVGWTNVGKSSLLNALADRALSIVADAPGVTRDHVGAFLELDGLAVQWIDTPGVRRDDAPAQPIEAEAARIARSVVDSADLIVSCEEATRGSPDFIQPDGREPLRVLTKCDLAPQRSSCSALRTACPPDLAGRLGVDRMARAIRSRLLPNAALEWPGPWLFDERIRPMIASKGGDGPISATRRC